MKTTRMQQRRRDRLKHAQRHEPEPYVPMDVSQLAAARLSRVLEEGLSRTYETEPAGEERRTVNTEVS